MMRSLIVVVAVALLSALGAEVAIARPPNVIIIYADDLGSVDLGCYGAADLETPHTDALAARGVRFTQFYSAAPVCSSSRAALLTGRYPVRCGVPANAGSQRGQKSGLPAAEVTLGEMFASADYATAHIGKWHLGYDDGLLPNQQGFQHSFGHMGGCIDNYSHFFYWSGPNVHDLYRNGQEIHEDGKYFPDLMVAEAKTFIDHHRDEPFFIYFAMNLPHYPYQGEAKWLERFKDLPHPRNLYAAFVASQDERIGALLKAVDDVNLTDETIVIFQSDNGHSTEERAHWGGGSAGPYRGAKFSLFEGGIRLPAIISWPGHVPAGETRGQLAHACDWLPTLAELCQVKIVNPEIDGASLVEVLKDHQSPSPHKVVHWQVGLGPGAQWAVRDGDWKLLGNALDTTDGHKTTKFDLFLANLADDPSEQTNQIAAHPDIVRRLQAEHAQWVKSAAQK
jgi:arylsulfatase A-like enzyme